MNCAASRFTIENGMSSENENGCITSPGNGPLQVCNTFSIQETVCMEPVVVYVPMWQV